MRRERFRTRNRSIFFVFAATRYSVGGCAENARSDQPFNGLVVTRIEMVRSQYRFAPFFAFGNLRRLRTAASVKARPYVIEYRP
jgi:hypothetical protein